MRKGTHLSEKSKDKLRNSLRGRIPWNKGKKLFYKTNGSFKKGMISWNKGRQWTLEERKKISEALPKRFGKHSANWQGGKSFEPYSSDWTDNLKESIRQRDNYICQECGIHQDELDRKLDIHHIDYIKNNLNPNNLISLCQSCHSKTNFNRDYWEKYFSKLLLNKN